MEFSSIGRVHALATVAVLALAGPAFAADFPTVPKAITKPGAGQSDDWAKTIGTKKGFLLGFHRNEGIQRTLFVQAFKADGKPAGKPVKVEGPGFFEGIPEFVALGGDKFGLVWKVMGPSLRSAIVDGATGKVGKPATVIDGKAASFIHDLASLAKGAAMVTRIAPGVFGEDTVLSILNAKMRPAGAPKLVEDDVPGQLGAASYEQTLVTFAGGGVALFRAADHQLAAAPFTAKGKLGKRFQVNTTAMPALNLLGLARFNVRAKPLPTGGYVVAWNVYDPGSSLHFDIRARVFDKTGKPVGPDFLVNQDQSGDQSAPEILVFGKSFAVAWTDKATLFQTTQPMRLFDFAGKPVSDEIVTEYFGADGEGVVFPSDQAEYASLPKGGVLKLFSADGKIYGDRIPAPSTKGANKDDLVVLGAGNDKISGGRGHDLIDAGAGNDTVDGGPGNDLIVAGPGNDDLSGGGDPDVFVFRPGGGEDVVQDFDADDRIDVSAFHYNQHAAVLADAKPDGPDVVLTLKDQNDPSAPPTVVRLKKRTPGQVTAANIIL